MRVPVRGSGGALPALVAGAWSVAARNARPSVRPAANRERIRSLSPRRGNASLDIGEWDFIFFSLISGSRYIDDLLMRSQDGLHCEIYSLSLRSGEGQGEGGEIRDRFQAMFSR